MIKHYEQIEQTGQTWWLPACLSWIVGATVILCLMPSVKAWFPYSSPYNKAIWGEPVVLSVAAALWTIACWVKLLIDESASRRADN